LRPIFWVTHTAAAPRPPTTTATLATIGAFDFGWEFFLAAMRLTGATTELRPIRAGRGL
jgi:hypothetical protein